MKYRAQLFNLIFSENEDALIEWITTQPALDQPEIFRELNEIVQELEESSGVPSGITGFDQQIALYEDQILDEKLAEANYQMALEERDKVFAEADEKMAGTRNYIIECIVNQAPNAAEMRELAAKIIQLEKESGIYDPQHWKEIE